MACCRPFQYFPPQSQLSSIRYKMFQERYPNGISIPCGYCLNCRVDKRNMWADRAKYEYSKRLTASFVTLTYDDIHLMYKMRIDVSNPQEAYLPTLDYKDAQRFVNRVRMRVKRFYDSHPDLKSNVLMQPDFSYIYVGEYGENGQVFDRPHFHFLFFGLDFAFCKKLLQEEWYGGFIDVLPLLDGGINYVLKYIDKQLFGDLAFEKYEAHGIARPKCSRSKSFGSGLYFDNIEYAKKHNMTYKSGRADRPYPAYYKHKFITTDKKDSLVYCNPLLDVQRLKEDMHSTYHLKDLSFKARHSFQLRKAQLRERKLRQMLLNDGVGVYDYTSDSDIYFSPNREKIRRLSPDVQHWLADDYRKLVADSLGVVKKYPSDSSSSYNSIFQALRALTLAEDAPCPF